MRCRDFDRNFPFCWRRAMRIRGGSCSVVRIAVGVVVAWTVSLGAVRNATADTVTAMPAVGPVQGIGTPTVAKFLGIPYAVPPVGALRWQPPQPHAPWTTPIDASTFGAHCPQITSPFGQPSTTEDCLFLNVYTPAPKGFPYAA